jgi:cation transport protein ChaC
VLERLSRSHIFSPEDGDMWIFAYGSLMWDPGFVVAARKKGRLFGWHRRFCVHSVIYRGTPENPGLSLGLDLGGSCVGFALKILEKDREQVLAYLSAREMPEEIYSCRSVIIFTADGPITAVTLTVNRDHRLYCPPLTIDDTARRISRGRGDRGKNRDYLEKTVALLAKEGIRDSSLIALLDRVRQLG